MAPEDADARRLMEGVVERRIREAIERGHFSDLPGAGKPLADLGEGYDPDWWAKRWVRRQRLEAEAADLRLERPRAAAHSVVDDDAARRLREIDARLAAIEQTLSGDREKPDR